jgi:hypothetical protein
MLQESVQKYIASLLLNFSDLCDTDSEIADCLTFLQIAPPANASHWSAEIVRQQMPLAYSTVCHTSQYAATQTGTVSINCRAVYNQTKQKELKHDIYTISNFDKRPR